MNKVRQASKVLVWWPPIALLLMVALGLAVGHGSTPLDDWFTRAGNEHHTLSHRLLFFTDLRVLFSIFLVSVAAALYRRRWRLAAAIVLTPIIAVVTERLAKQGFQRRYEGALAYPSGHTTLTVVLLGLAVVAVGAATWTIVVAVVYAVFAAIGLSVTYHYFTDTIGGLLLGTAMVCLAIGAAGLDRCQPACDLRHNDG